jgi:hypothetical protein
VRPTPTTSLSIAEPITAWPAERDFGTDFMERRKREGPSGGIAAVSPSPPLFSACSAENGEQLEENELIAEADVLETKEEALSSFRLGEQEVTVLISYTGDSPTEEGSHLVLQVVGKAGDPDYVSATELREGELTTLEWFHALAPAELIEPEALVKAHEIEGLAMGRSDVAVKPVARWEVATDGAPSVGVDKLLPMINPCWPHGYNSMRVTPRRSGFGTVAHLCAGGENGAPMLGATGSTWVRVPKMVMRS